MFQCSKGVASFSYAIPRLPLVFVGAPRSLPAFLCRRAKVKMALEHLPQHLPILVLSQTLHLVVAELHRVQGATFRAVTELHVDQIDRVLSH